LRELSRIYSEAGGELKEFEKFKGEFEVGARITYEKRLTEADVVLFGLVSGDLNPVHFDEEMVSKTRFGGRVVHRMLTMSLVSRPWPGSLAPWSCWRTASGIRPL